MGSVVLFCLFSVFSVFSVVSSWRHSWWCRVTAAARAVKRGAARALDTAPRPSLEWPDGTLIPFRRDLVESMWDINLIHLFSFYLVAAFALSSAQRVRQYQAILSLVRAFPSRWPRLLDLVKQHRSLFLTWSTLAPGVLALGLWLIQTLASRLVWPEAGQPPYGLTLGRLFESPFAVPFVVVFGAAMAGVDVYFIAVIGKVDRREMETYFDQAEYWLKSWTAPVLRAVTFGLVNPRKMVAVEVRTSLVSASQLLNTALWWVVLQTGLRIAYGLSLWLTYALQRTTAA